MNDHDESKLRDLLKKTPALTPPESFYTKVLEEIERKNAPEEKTPWYWNFPAKTLASACLVLIIVMVTRETRKSKPELFQRIDKAEQQEAPHEEPAPMLLEHNAPGASAPRSADLKIALPKGVPHAERHREVLADKDTNRNLIQLAGKADSPASAFTPVPVEVEEKLQTKGITPIAALGYRAVPVAAGADAESSTDGMLFDQIPEKKKMAYQKTEARNKNEGTLDYVTNGAALGARYDLAKQTSLWKGTNSNITTFQSLVIRTPGEWQALWLQHAHGQPIAPVVDFNQFMIVGVFAGTRRDLAGITIDNVQELPDQVVVFYKEEPLAPNQGLASSENRPFHIQPIPKTTRPVIFKKS